MVNNPLIRPTAISWGGAALGNLPLNSHEKTLGYKSKSKSNIDILQSSTGMTRFVEGNIISMIHSIIWPLGIFFVYDHLTHQTFKSKTCDCGQKTNLSICISNLSHHFTPQKWHFSPLPGSNHPHPWTCNSWNRIKCDRTCFWSPTSDFKKTRPKNKMAGGIHAMGNSSWISKWYDGILRYMAYTLRISLDPPSRRGLNLFFAGFF